MLHSHISNDIKGHPTLGPLQVMTGDAAVTALSVCHESGSTRFGLIHNVLV